MSAGFDGILFDLDGTLWDARESICLTWNTVISENYPELRRLKPGDFDSQLGKLLPDIGHSLFPEASDEMIEDILTKCQQKENEIITERGGKLFEGLEPMLGQLAVNAKLFIVSNCQGGYIEAFFAAHGLQKYFADWQDSGAPGSKKSTNIRRVVERNGLQRPVYVGDTQLDGQSAYEAGTAFIWASYGFGKAERFDAELDDVRKLPALCKTLSEKLYG